MVPFGPRGARLWAAYCEQAQGELGLVLLEEVCRTADVWCRLVHNLRTETYELQVDAALSEARQQANALRQLIAALPLKERDEHSDPDSWLDDMSSEVRDPAGSAVPDIRD